MAPTAADLARENYQLTGDPNADAGAQFGMFLADMFDGTEVRNTKGSGQTVTNDNDLGDQISNNVASVASKFVSGSDSASIGGNQGQLSMVNSAQDINYINADLAKAYGMDASTAYQEALSNTAYQRAVMDAKNAGLNPALMFSSGSSASSFAGSMPKASGHSAKEQSGMDISAIGSALGAVAGLVIGKSGQGMYAGKEVGNAVGSIVEGLIGLGKS